MDKYLIIDGSSILFRAFYALPSMSTKTGKNTNAVLGFINILLKSIDIIKPKGIAVCFDLKGPTFRSNIYDQYKANRPPTPDELSEQFIYIKEILKAFDIKHYELEGYEADDIAGTISKKLNLNGYNVYLLSGDKDYLQLVNDKTKLLYTKKGVSELAVYDTETIMDEMGINPRQIVDLKALMGDKSDNIPGIVGVGEKTALKLLYKFENVENLYENQDLLKPNKTNQRIKDGKEIVFISKELARIDTDVPIIFDYIDIALKEFDENKLSEVLGKYELNSIIQRLNLKELDNVNNSVEKVIKYPSNPEEVLGLIHKNKCFAFKLLGDKKPHFGGKVFKIGIFVNNQYFIMDIEDGDLSDFADVFQDENITKSGYELKEDILFLINQKIELKKYNCDIRIGEYLLEPTINDYSVNRLSTKYGFVVENNFPDKKQLTASPKLWDNNIQNDYLISILNLIQHSERLQKEKLKELGLMNLYNDIELPLIYVLADMEYTGIKIDKVILNEIGKTLDFQLENLVDTIYSLAGEEFNINSTKQLAEILFEKLKLPVIKRTKTGYSTDIEVLEKLEDKHEIISYLIRYRTISKLKSTYVDGMTNFINDRTGGRIHSNFNQTVAATGRLSSQDPNLQNIPVKTDEGRELRKIFIASDPGKKLIDADYSQIELRILADISQDNNMLESFTNSEDIHTTTASKVFDIAPNEVTPLLRSRAKAVNFGIVYGISDYGLSQDLKISRNEAKTYIDNYLKRFFGVNKYMKEIVDKAKYDGYVETKFGRKRFLPELNSKNWNIRSFGERIALNMPIQGTAADIIKIAMVNVYRKMKILNFKSKLILQVHDELIIEAPLEEVDDVKKILTSEMENAVKLSVPLTVDIDIGDSWYETK